VKLIRLTDDKYIFDAGPDMTASRMEEIRKFWDEWWATETERPSVVVVGGHEYPLAYEDRREPDIEARLRRLEEHIHATDYHRSGPPLGADE